MVNLATLSAPSAAPTADAAVDETMQRGIEAVQKLSSLSAIDSELPEPPDSTYAIQQPRAAAQQVEALTMSLSAALADAASDVDLTALLLNLETLIKENANDVVTVGRS